MESRLNPGDKVVCVDNLSAGGLGTTDLVVGQVYEVAQVWKVAKFCLLSVKELPAGNCWAFNRFKKKEASLGINEYQTHALRTAAGSIRSDCFDSFDLVLNGALGLAGEAGEVVDLIKKYLYQGHPLDKEKLVNELGDVCWYVAVLADGLGYRLEDVMQGNVEKLRKRYPNGFDASRSLNRED